MTAQELMAWLQESKKDLVQMLDKLIPLCENKNKDAESILNETLETIEEIEKL
jgi:hypothetical protein